MQGCRNFLWQLRTAMTDKGLTELETRSYQSIVIPAVNLPQYGLQ